MAAQNYQLHEKNLGDFTSKNYSLVNKLKISLDKVVLPPDDITTFDLQIYKENGLVKSTLQTMPSTMQKYIENVQYEVALPPEDITMFDLSLHRQNES